MHNESACTHDDALLRFEAEGARPLPQAQMEGFIDHDHARIWYASFGSGPPIILLHGGLGNSSNWGCQLATLLQEGYRVLLIDSRGHGRSTRDEGPYSYERMGSDVLAVMDALPIGRAAFMGWSDGACTALILADRHPERVAGVVFFACNMDPGGVRPFEMSPAIERCLSRHRKDYARLSSTPGDFDRLMADVGAMQRTQPDYHVNDLHRIRVPVLVLHAEHDEFIRREHSEHLAATIPGARFQILPSVSHFAPVQRPESFTAALLPFLREVS